MSLVSTSKIGDVLSQIEFGSKGLIPAVTQDDSTGEVLMVGFMNRQALQLTLETGFTHFFSRSRQRIWKKGEKSGNVQAVESLRTNCDSNSVLLQVNQVSAVCHDGYRTCYYRQLDDDGHFGIIIDRTFDPDLVYGPGKATIQLWFSTYEYLRDHVDPEQSGTARAIADLEFDAVSRLADELIELAGVVSGTHHHGTRADDLVLESSQIFYWVMVLAMRNHISLQQLGIDRAMSPALSRMGPIAMAHLLETEAEMYRSGAVKLSPERLFATIALVAQVLQSQNIEPIRPVEFDLDQMKKRPYLSHLFDESYHAGESSADN